jgi:hypothetical protein
MTYQQLHKKYGISLRDLKTAIDEALLIIKTECKKTQTL